MNVMREASPHTPSRGRQNVYSHSIIFHYASGFGQCLFQIENVLKYVGRKHPIKNMIWERKVAAIVQTDGKMTLTTHRLPGNIDTFNISSKRCNQTGLETVSTSNLENMNTEMEKMLHTVELYAAQIDQIGHDLLLFPANEASGPRKKYFDKCHTFQCHAMTKIF